MTLYKVTPETTFVNQLGKWRDLDGPREAFLPDWAKVNQAVALGRVPGLAWHFVGFDDDVAYVVSNEP